MLLSMTGYGQAAHSAGELACTVELRAVNNRFLKINVRLPDAYAGLEARLEKLVRDGVKRGTVTVNVRLQGASASAGCRFNAELFRHLTHEICRHSPALAEDRVALALLAMPDLFERAGPSDDHESVWVVVEKAVHAAFAGFDKMRRDEGAAMARELGSLASAADAVVTSIEGRTAISTAEQRDRLFERVEGLLRGHDVVLEKSDLIREAATLAERCDVVEEIVRLRSHLGQIQSLLKGGDNAGRKLDFLTQELHREANTIGAKANDLEIAHAVVDLKTQIERIREIVQNVE